MHFPMPFFPENCFIFAIFFYKPSVGFISLVSGIFRTGGEGTNANSGKSGNNETLKIKSPDHCTHPSKIYSIFFWEIDWHIANKQWHRTGPFCTDVRIPDIAFIYSQCFGSVSFGRIRTDPDPLQETLIRIRIEISFFINSCKNQPKFKEYNFF